MDASSHGTSRPWLSRAFLLLALAMFVGLYLAAPSEAFAASAASGTVTKSGKGTPPDKSHVKDKPNTHKNDPAPSSAIPGVICGANGCGDGGGDCSPNVTSSWKQSVCYDIIFVHGILGSSSSGATGVSCTGTWNTAMNYLIGSHPTLNGSNFSWAGNLHTVRYYAGDTGCSDNISSGVPGSSNCSSLLGGHPAGTTQEPIESIACKLAWFIYDNYSSHGKNVDLVAHSMGGLVARMAIYGTQINYHGVFPPYIYVQDAVTFATPHNGVDLATWNCSNCYEGQEMVPGSVFISTLNSNLSPQAAGPGTDWTVMGSTAWTDPVDIYSAVHISYGHRLIYDEPPNYSHGGYLTDTSDGYFAKQWYCDGCVESNHSFPVTYSAPCSLHNMLFALIYHDW